VVFGAVDGEQGGYLGTVAKPTKRKVPGKGPTPKGGGRPAGGRVTEKGTRPVDHTHIPSTVADVGTRPPSPMWVPVLMFGLFAVGSLVIFLNYVGLLPGAASNWYLLGGLGLILAGIITATQYR